jgi:hypothetical protein
LIENKTNYRLSNLISYHRFCTFFLHSASWGDSEVISTEFPFDINQQFKIALAFTDNEFKVAVNGSYLMSFSLDNIDLEDGQSLWEILTGFQIKAANDLNVKISHVEHFVESSNCDGFESFSAL